MTPANLDVEARLNLVKDNRSAIYVMLCRAASGGRPVGDAVVVIADTSDKVGRELATAAAAMTGLSIHDEVCRVQQRGEIPSVVCMVSIDDARSLFSVSHPSVANGLGRQPLQGCVRVVSIAAGAAMLVHTDVRPTSPIADA